MITTDHGTINVRQPSKFWETENLVPTLDIRQENVSTLKIKTSTRFQTRRYWFTRINLSSSFAFATEDGTDLSIKLQSLCQLL